MFVTVPLTTKEKKMAAHGEYIGVVICKKNKLANVVKVQSACVSLSTVEKYCMCYWPVTTMRIGYMVIG